ncbi:MAG: sugar phosphate isomerase/epimerase [Verrucomicrobia bacterium]|nr:sugar phosphate isomerase/epimerase [Verrucomicrobiota bacterium]
MKLGVYSILLPTDSIEQAVERAAKHGFQGIEWTVGYPPKPGGASGEWHLRLDNFKEDAQRAGHAARSAGIEIVSLGVKGLHFNQTELIRRVAEAALLMGCRQFRVGTGGYDPARPYAQMFDEARRGLDALQKLGRELGIRFLFEMHAGTIHPSASAMFRLIEGFDPQRIGVIYDPGNMILEGMERWLWSVELLRDHIAHVHVKDYGWGFKNGRWEAEPAAFGQGLADWTEIIAALRKIGYAGCLHTEDFRGGYCVKPVGISEDQKLAEAHSFFGKLIEFPK